MATPCNSCQAGAVHEAINTVSRGSLAVDGQDGDERSSHWQIERAGLKQLLGEVLQQEFRELSTKLMKETLSEEFRRLAATCFADGPGSPGTAAGTFRAPAAGTASGTSGAFGDPECAALPCLSTSLSDVHSAQPDASFHSPRSSLSGSETGHLDGASSEATSSAQGIWRHDTSNASSSSAQEPREDTSNTPILLAQEHVLVSSAVKMRRQSTSEVRQTQNRIRKAKVDVTLQKHLAVSKLDHPNTGFRGSARGFVSAALFDYCISAVLVLNAVSIGVQAEYQARVGSTPESSAYFQSIEGFFGFIFAVELGLRIYVAGVKHFFFGNAWLSNLFDVVLVVLQIVDSVITLTMTSEAGFVSFGFLRILRLFRVARMVRLVRLVPGLKSMVFLIGASLSSFVWAAVLMLLIMYCLAVYFTILASETEVSDSEEHLVKLYWGSIGGSVLSLFMAVSGGADWHQFLLVFGQGSLLYILNSFLLSIYVGFAILVMLNLVTGVLVEGAQNIMRSEKETELVKMAAQIFVTAGKDSDSEMTKEEFENLSLSPAMNKYCHEVGMTLDEADNLFEFLDRDDSGSVSIAEFVQGCLRLRGPAKALDLAELRLWSKDNSQDTLKAIRSLRIMVSQLAYNQTLLFASAGQASEHPLEKDLHIEELCSKLPLVSQNRSLRKCTAPAATGVQRPNICASI
ncbi:unnamed protein product [Polarella glacialis]|uniref:EF-hand domain-containing protein n=1 Tax=Polarella glacialis TaxID=89957 RepID=A0A813G3V5_POLGL|nr:unnamed protein product [Polarella glacialis]